MLINSVKWLLVVSCFMSFLFVGCTEETKVEPKLPYNDLSTFFETEAPTEQKFTIDPTTAQTITGAQGTKIQFYANSFVDAQGNAVTGQVDFKLKEVYSKGDMIWAERMTMASNGQLLESGGEFFMEATSGGQEVFLSQNYEMTVPVRSATANPNAMGLFIQASDSTWTPADSLGGWVGVDSLGSNYNVYFDSLSWINCDYFYNSTQGLTAINVEPTLPSGVTLTDVSAYLVFSNINSVASMWYNGTNNFSISGMPVGQAATIVVIGMDGTQFYMGTLATTLTNSTAISVPLSVTTQAQITTTIGNL